MTDDSEIVRLSDGVMAGRHPLTDQARRGEIRGEEDEEGKPGSFVFQSGETREEGTAEKKKIRSAQVAAMLLVEDQEAPIRVNDVFKRDQMCSIKLASIRCRSVISKMVCSRCEALTLGRLNERPNQTRL